MVHRGPKSWATVEEEAFLKALLPEYRKCRYQKAYANFWINTLRAFFNKWPECMRLHCDPNSGIPAEEDLTPHQREIVGQAITKHKQVIKRWFSWQVNMARLARSCNSRGVLNLDDTLGGGASGLGGSRAPQEVEVYSQYHYNAHVKATADTVITAEGISSRGVKLSKWKEVTRIIYATEDDGIHTKVKEKHAEILTKWKHDHELAKAGAFNELGSHLDQIFHHLSYKTGGLKFTCIAGGRDPRTGEVVVVNFHLGETGTGAEFSACYPGFSDVQVAYADFVKDAVAHDDKMQLLMSDSELEALTVSKDADDLEWNFEDNNGNIHNDEDGHTSDLTDHIPQDCLATLQAIPDVDPGTGTGTPTTTGEWFNDHLHTESEPLLFDDFDPSVLVPYVIDHSGDTYFPSSNDIPYEYPASASVLSNSLPIQDLDSDYIYDDKLAYLSQGLDFSHSDNRALSEPIIPPPIVPSGAVLPDELPCLPAVPDMPQAATPQPQTTVPQILSPSLPNGTAGGTATGTATSTSGCLASLAAEQPKGPRHTTRQHVPSKREQALNDIGSSNARICAGAGVTRGKENDGSNFTPTKRKAKPANPQANK
ncbi:uncharacterized protein EDB91DRAFT_1086394 [Suillus paluster]|uniref:uncharacterized protein n=1 Tax=Suillus paluster TaxID=48578 RepID=UPI001B8709D3|nr:uncharacterized protein EDB91DRAFT_1086394 [Suillus paluster]KAG1727452.1 hypothetical protein EDB91DRAFT_1086394 [Suillus paluster]